MAYEIPRHKVFISYYHADDQEYKNQLIDTNNLYKSFGNAIFVDYSVHEDEIDDTDLTSEQIRQIIRDDYIKDATVLILLCGENTKTRKHIDWELHAAMFDTQKNPKLGILVVNLPIISQSCKASGDKEKELVSPSSIWTSVSTRKEYEEKYPYIPDRIIDNFAAAIADDSIIPIAVVNWSRVCNVDILKQLIDIAYNRGHSEKYYSNSRKMRERNS